MAGLCRSSAAFTLLACAFGFLAASRAHAQDAVWLSSPMEQREAWYGPIRTGLDAEGVLVREAPAGATACDPACAVENARALGLRVAVRVRVAARRDGRLESAVVVLETVDGRAGEAALDVARRDLAAAVRAAYRQAELALELGEHGLLRVTTSPEGVVVTIDGEPAGLAPFDRKLRAGGHEVLLTLDGFSSERRQLSLARGQVTELRAQLVRVTAAHALAAARAPSPLNWILGGALAIGAVPALVISIDTLVSEGHCHKRDSFGGCLEQVHFGTRSALLLGFGSAALLAAGYVLIAAPFTVEAQAEARGARVVVAARF